jgi:hypothetical protein
MKTSNLHMTTRARFTEATCGIIVSLLDHSAMLLTLIPLWKIRRAPNNASKRQMGFNSAFKGLRNTKITMKITNKLHYID